MCSENERAKWGEREPRFVVTEKKERKKERKKEKKRKGKKRNPSRKRSAFLAIPPGAAG